MQFYNKDDVYQEDIRPLLEEISRICEQHSIQFTTCFQTQARADGERNYVHGRIINDDDFPAGQRLYLMHMVGNAPEPALNVIYDKLGSK